MACPGCAVMSNRVHSAYGKRLADTPVGDRPVLIELTARRLYCENVRCSACEARKKAQLALTFDSEQPHGEVLPRIGWGPAESLQRVRSFPALVLDLDVEHS
ncbi:transposase family protein [Streptomyces sp. GbtcB7]|uniref:transposase family protein n=1 Tax=Streptomyces sp. GbtcB7 TaxID=2824752 RepID=UPI0027E55109|nr:transposase family protein [Streptomyces sp. GbtcB7]